MSDPIGPSGLRLIVLDTQDSVWTGRPGDDTLVRVRAFNPHGEPVAGARLTWEPTGTGSNVRDAAVVTDHRGFAVARWRIGTDAAERQQLRLTARQSGSLAAVVIAGRVVPHVVASLRVAVDTPVAFRLGDTLALPVLAVDPYSNTFSAPDLVSSSDDSTIVGVRGGTLTSAVRRGNATVTFASSGHELRVPVRVVQVVAGIEPAIDTLRFSSLGAELPLQLVVRDDRGYVVPDTSVAIAVSDTAVARAVGSVVRSVASGSTALDLSLGSARTTMEVAVRQRVASLQLMRDTVRLDALQDTTTIHLVARDSLGAIIRNPPVVYRVSDGTIAKLGADQTLEALTPGAAVLTAMDMATGISASAEVVVSQRVATIELGELRFDALGDTVLVIATARDRLGSVVPDAALEYGVTDTGVATLVSGQALRSVGPGQTRLTALDVETGVAASTGVTVTQIPARIIASLTTTDSIVDLPLNAVIPVACEARDRNDYLVPGVPSVLPSSGARWIGTRCDSLRVVRPGVDTLRLVAGPAHGSLGLVLVVRPPDLQSAIPVVARVTAGPYETFVSWVQPDTQVDAAAVWIRALGAPSWNHAEVSGGRSWFALPGRAPGTQLEIALALSDARGSIRGAFLDTATVGNGDACRSFAGRAGTDLRVFCTGPELLAWVSAQGLDLQAVRCGNESLDGLADVLPNCVFEAGTERLLLLRGLDDDFRPGPALPQPLLETAYRQVLFGQSSPEATVWRNDPAIGTPVSIPRAGAVTGYRFATSWYTDVNMVGMLTWFEPIQPNGAIAIYHEGHGGDATEIGAETISWLLQSGWSVVSLNLPRVPHMYLRDRYSEEGRTLWRMLSGIGQVTEWIHNSWSPGRDPVVVAIGRSGGGWASLLYAALDQRIDATAVVSGFVPMSQRLETNGLNLGDWEQIDPLTFGAVDYTDIVRLASTRDMLVTYSERDDCCFRKTPADPFVQWLGVVAQETPATLTTVVSDGHEHGLSPAGYSALKDLLDRALARGH